jgi:peptide/nickel transport system substrate-binding protein
MLSHNPLQLDMNNAALLGQTAPGLGPLLHFLLGETHVDPFTGESFSVPRDDGHPITDPVFRHAMSLAVDRRTIDENFNHGLSRPASSILTPFNAEEYIDPNSPGMSLFDLNLANAMLDEAGYVWGSEGFRLDLNGQPFVVNFAMTHSANNEIIFAMHQQNMRAIGIDFRLHNDSWTDFLFLVNYLQSFHGQDPTPQSRNSDLHVFQMSWSLGINPDPSSLWGDGQWLNLSKFTTPALQNALDRMNAPQSWDPAFFGQAMRDFAAEFDAQRPAITASWHVIATAVNNRVANYSVERGHFYGTNAQQWHRVGLTAERPFVHQ